MSQSKFKLIANDDPINRNLVIIVNKNGDVATDTVALQTLLTSRETPETGVTVIRETSPTPSISDEIEEDRLQQNELLKQEYLADNPDASDDEIEEHLKQLVGADKVPHVTLNVENFYAPSQAKKFAKDVLHLGGIDNPQTLMPIDYNFRRQIVQNDHCYTPLMLSPNDTKGKSSKTGTKGASKEPKASKKEPKVVKARQVLKDEMDSSDSEDFDEEQSAEEEEISFSESDDDNDMDFSVNDRFGKKGKKKRKYRRHKQKSMTFKDFLEGGGEMTSSMDDEPKKKYGKSPKKASAQRTSGKSIGPSTSKNPALIRKIPNPQQANKNAVLRKEPPVAAAVTVKPSASSVIGQISIQSAAPVKSTQEIEFVESIVKDLEKSFPVSDKKPPPPPTTIIPNIMQMMETNTPAEVIDQSLSTLENIDGNVGIEEIGNAIIAALGNEAIDELLNQGDLMNFESTIKPSLVSSLQQPIMSDLTTLPLTASNSSPLPKILNRQAPGKDAIKVVRNGRVITLPPIEAPATRGAKRRAQGDPISPVSKIIKAESKTPPAKDSDSRNSSRRSSLNKSESGRNSRRQSLTAPNAAADENDENSDASWNSEDDPDRLWCICKQPHSNRFMICCDKCEDWFHGTCVNVTKAMGKEIEKQNIKWLCPNCKTNAGAVKKDPNKKTLSQQKLTKFFSKNMKESTDEDVPKASIMCAVCHKKPARTDSIYCSEDCIRNHATKHLDDSVAQPKTPPASKAGEKRGNVLKDQSGNVSVYHKITGKLLSAKLWPHITNLGQWLSQNPNYEPVKPGSHHANQLLSRSSKNSQAQAITSNSAVTSTSQTAPAKHQPGDELFSNPIKINTGTKDAVLSPIQKKISNVASPIIRTSTSPVIRNTSTPVRPPLQKSSSVSSSTSSKSVSAPKVQQDVKKVKRQASDEKPPPPPPSSLSSNKSKIEYERMNVRTNLKSTLMQRMKDIVDSAVPKMKEDEIEKFAKAIEHEMFIFFNKDTRDKYKVKFRSLKFNLSDTKNKTLIERICMKKLTPKQLVELPSSELASKELSKWREEENKHQLEIITKAELDALAQTKMVLKTHKGEEIIETKPVADISLPDDDVESVIEKTVLSVDDPHGKYDLSRSMTLNVSGSHSVSSPLSSPSISSTSGRKSDSHHQDSRSRSKSRGRDHHNSSHHKSSKHKKHKSRSPQHHRSRDKSRGRRSRDKSHERDKSPHETSKKSHSREKHRRDRSRSNERDKTRSKESRESSKDSKKHQHHHSSSKEVKESMSRKEEPLKVEIKPEQEDVDIVGKILDSMGVHLETPTKKSDEENKTPAEDAKMPEVSSSEAISVPISTEPINEHQLEIEIYSGNMYMADVANIDVTASVVSGNVDDIVKLFNPQMEIVGRIEPKTVWDYLGKVKKLPGKDLAVIRFASTDESAYFSLFSYLHSRQRFGVIKSPAPTIKDFYLITVEAKRPLPSVLLPIVGPGFIEGDDHKPDLLLGVILKIMPESKHVHKKSATTKKGSKTSKSVEHTVPIQILPTKHKSHSGSSKLTLGLPELRSDDNMKLSPKKSPSSKDDDEPYTPFDDDDSLTPPPSYGHHSTKLATVSRTKLNTTDLETEMEKLNREIERRQMEIQTLAQQKALELNEEQATKIFEKISVPHNLSEILSTIKAGVPKPMDIDEEYVPSASKSTSLEYRALSNYSALSATTVAPIISSMMDIDERINLFRQEIPINIVSEPPSRLATMSDADLLALVPEDALQAPPPPIISSASNSINSEPAIPGLEGYELEL